MAMIVCDLGLVGFFQDHKGAVQFFAIVQVDDLTGEVKVTGSRSLRETTVQAHQHAQGRQVYAEAYARHKNEKCLE